MSLGDKLKIEVKPKTEVVGSATVKIEMQGLDKRITYLEKLLNAELAGPGADGGSLSGGGGAEPLGTIMVSN